ncbi:tRNA pseudouridine(38-40) synthase TruA [Jeotgalibacillus soli]|uniref:tRNA pseudouridine synthase A n=1 Tax=Jeotgalibacillus soli TaxID=889306 RepID=A0A0C2W716_9BACL|nr:tRNA pseudouridine(38-40) synthase TruA [Jeotgalibacillus soli]KIL52371.1 tRNA pseudouridine synthase A [Jeotgalibacillus soli]
MPRIKCVVSYDGSGFAGYQVQPGMRTVQLELERALKKIHKGVPTFVSASGRTDSGVHAVGQVIHFDTDFHIPDEKWPTVLNQRLPHDVVVLEAAAMSADTFHARFSVVAKEYRYHLNRGQHRSPFRRNYAFYESRPLNIALMQEAAQYFVGTHDFTSFCSIKTEVADRTRTIERFDIVEQGEEWIFSVKGNGFLYNMVRIMIGTLLGVGYGRFKPEDIPDMLAAKDRNRAGKTAPAHGLYLWQVDYKEV